MTWFVGRKEYERAKAEAYNRGWDQGLKDYHEAVAEKRSTAGGIPSGDACTVGISNPPPPPSRPMTRVEAMKLVREAMTRTNIVADTVGTDVNGGFGDSWALGQVLVLEALDVLKVSS